MVVNKFSVRVKELRKKLGMNQKEFAMATNIKQSTLSSYETEKITPTAEVLIAIAQTCQVSVDWLLGLSDERDSISANFYARIEPEIKRRAEIVLNELGIPASNALTMFYKQIILCNGLPFEVKLQDQPLERSLYD